MKIFMEINLVFGHKDNITFLSIFQNVRYFNFIKLFECIKFLI